MKQVLLIDNYDSFTFNLVHYLRTLGAEVTVWRNDEFALEEVSKFNTIVLSPGPGLPSESGLLMETLRKYASTKNILGVCLGLQAITECFGGSLKNLSRVYHGISSEITILDTDDTLFKGMDSKIQVGRYHSWAINEIGPILIPTSRSEDGEIMSIRHPELPLYGVQFHPESILTPNGMQILSNWLNSLD